MKDPKSFNYTLKTHQKQNKKLQTQSQAYKLNKLMPVQPLQPSMVVADSCPSLGLALLEDRSECFLRLCD